MRWTVDTHGEHAEREPIMGVWGRSPQQSTGAERLVRGSGVKPPEAENLLASGAQRKQQICFMLRDHDRPEIDANPVSFYSGGVGVGDHPV